MRTYNSANLFNDDFHIYFDLEKGLIEDFKPRILNSQVAIRTGEVGVVVDVLGQNFDSMIICVDFGAAQKKYDINVGLHSKFITVPDNDLVSIYNDCMSLHNELTNMYTYLKAEEDERLTALKREEEARIKEEEARIKAEEMYERRKENAIKSFENHINREARVCDESGDFYYALGWLAKNVRTVSAVLPDYLYRSFNRHFGDVPCRVTNSNHRGPAGYQSQWSWSFSASLNNADEVPGILTRYMNPSATCLSNTGFIWDLIDNYNFKFGKEQDIEEIMRAVPFKYMDSFCRGFNEE